MKYTIKYNNIPGTRITLVKTFDNETDFIECVTLDRKDGYCFWTEKRTEKELIIQAI